MLVVVVVVVVEGASRWGRFVSWLGGSGEIDSPARARNCCKDWQCERAL